MELNNQNAFLEPGMRVIHPQYPEWGIGQVQSLMGHRVTVNFPETGKLVIDGRAVVLNMVHDTI